MQPLSLTEFIKSIFFIPRNYERMISLVQVRDYVILTTDYAVYRIEGTADERRFEVRQIGVV